MIHSKYQGQVAHCGLGQFVTPPFTFAQFCDGGPSRPNASVRLRLTQSRCYRNVQMCHDYLATGIYEYDNVLGNVREA